MAKKGSKLTIKKAAFVNAFLGQARGNATEAAVLAGYGKSRRTARQIAHELLTKPDIQAAIAARVLAKEKAAIADSDERDTILTEIARKAGARNQDRISAVKELNKCSGRHSMKHLHEGKLTLEEALHQVNGGQ